MQNDLLNSLQKILESDEYVLFYFKDDRIECSTLLNSYDVELSSSQIKIETGWTVVKLNMNDVLNYEYDSVLNGYYITGDKWSMYLHTSGTM